MCVNYRMPVKKTKKPRTRRAPAKKKGLKQKQKQKQQQKVNVQVSTGGGGGGTQFIPMPSAPVFDYAQLASLIRPANTVDVPIRAQANPEPLPAREAAAPSLKELTSKNLRFSEAEPEELGYESIVEEKKKGGKGSGKPRGSYKEKAINVGRNIQNIFAMGASSNPYTSEVEREETTTGGGKAGASFL